MNFFVPLCIHAIIHSRYYGKESRLNFAKQHPIIVICSILFLALTGLTANVWEQDKQACLQAGMNAHMAKPLERERLEAAILALLPAKV